MSILGEAWDSKIKGFEGWAPRAQWDYKQHTNGWGTRALRPGEMIDQAEAQRRYDAEIAKAHGIVRGFAPGLDDGTTAALTSLTFNAGADWTKSGLGRAIKDGNLDEAKKRFVQYVNAGGQPNQGLANRRNAEVGWIGSGAPDMAKRERDYQWNDVLPMEEQAQPAPPQVAGFAQRAQQPEQQAQPSTMDRIMAGFSNPMFQQGLGLLLASYQGKDMNQGMSAGSERASALQQAMLKNYQLQQQMEQQKKIKELLADGSKMAGIPPALVDIARTTGDPSAIQQFVTKQAGDRTDDIKEYEYAVKAGFKGTLQDWMVNKRNSQGEYNKNLVYGTDGQGNIVPLQAGSRGDIVASKMPDGVRLQRDPIKMDLGDKFGFMDPTTRQIIGYAPKNLAEAERQKEVGTAAGKAQSDLPAVQSNAANLTGYIDQVLNDPYLDNMIGYAGYTANVTPQARTLQSKIDQLKGQAFLIAFQNLKGAGAITEVEGAKATAALGRLQEMVQKGEDYRQALKDFKGEVERMVELAKTRAKGGGQLPTPGGAPAVAGPQKLRFNPTTGQIE